MMKKLLLLSTLAACLAVSAVGAEIPRPAPDLTIPLPGGKQVKLTDYSGKVLIVAFILTT
jgi:hypothetical protein